MSDAPLYRTREEAMLEGLESLRRTALLFQELRKGMQLMAADPARRGTLEAALADFDRVLPPIQAAARELTKARAQLQQALKPRRWSMRA